MKTRSTGPASNGARNTNRVFSKTDYLRPEIFDGRDGIKKVSLPGFKGVAFLTSEQFTWLVEQAKLGAFDDVIYRLVQEG